MDYLNLAGVISVPLLVVLGFFLKLAIREIDNLKKEIKVLAGRIESENKVLHGRIDKKVVDTEKIDLKLDDVIERLTRVETKQDMTINQKNQS